MVCEGSWSGDEAVQAGGCGCSCACPVKGCEIGAAACIWGCAGMPLPLLIFRQNEAANEVYGEHTSLGSQLFTQCWVWRASLQAATPV